MRFSSSSKSASTARSAGKRSAVFGLEAVRASLAGEPEIINEPDEDALDLEEGEL